MMKFRRILATFMCLLLLVAMAGCSANVGDLPEAPGQTDGNAAMAAAS